MWFTSVRGRHLCPPSGAERPSGTGKVWSFPRELRCGHPLRWFCPGARSSVGPCSAVSYCSAPTPSEARPHRSKDRSPRDDRRVTAGDGLRGGDLRRTAGCGAPARGRAPCLPRGRQAHTRVRGGPLVCPPGNGPTRLAARTDPAGTTRGTTLAVRARRRHHPLRGVRRRGCRTVHGGARPRRRRRAGGAAAGRGPGSRGAARGTCRTSPESLRRTAVALGPDAVQCQGVRVQGGSR